MKNKVACSQAIHKLDSHNISFLNILLILNKTMLLDAFQVKSKLGIISSYADATEGLITHGWITKIEKH